MEKYTHIELEVWEEIERIAKRECNPEEDIIDDLLREALVNRMCLSYNGK